ncbi:MAG: VWA domain-containing protein [Candidatus Marinimicrobia bacterium]|nr:VWA domain-containing protein [Candidatus Neomarinimicrobiota bacterium]MDD5581782.1 VWA domain-containing protein [Candidatus Neomarinimicrobiota bacterium]
MFRFQNPEFFFTLFLLIPCFIVEFRYLFSRHATLKLGTVSPLRESAPKYPLKILIPLVLKYLAFIFIIIALTRPQKGNVTREFTQPGIDIVIALDISGSMRAVDFQPNRLEAAKKVAIDFVKGRQTDRIGLVVFAAEAFLQCPLTVDYDVLNGMIQDVQIIPENLDGTAIGLAIANSVNRLRDSDAKSKVIILLSDGDNNAGEIDPLTAADFAREFNIKIYTIAMGMQGQVRMPVDDPLFGRRMIPVQIEINEDLLKGIAEKTGGKFFRADSEEKLTQIWQEISRMEKTDINISQFTDWEERFNWFLIPAIILLVLQWLLRYVVWRVKP